ncbi:MAG TPA: amidohydrolase family protein [Gemmatimonadales bacterium]|jgi:5-methylthioadenosine/S-adenosylhomocysteine deaminase|nr:amidohydrolase family protein [Gemmatimonadales bacterium]
MAVRRYQARWLVPIERPPVEGGAVLIGGDGRIVAVGEAARVPCPPGAVAVDLGEVALLPGLVNAHTHLELTGFEGRNDEPDFPTWIRRIIALKAGRGPEEFLAAARQGLRDCWAAGITTVADTGDSGAGIAALAALGGSGIAYHEVFGPEPDRAEASFAALVRAVERLREFEGPRVRLGVSPHAPYSVSGPLYRRVAAWARAEGLPLAVHLAESREESDLLERGTGGFARAWQGRGIPLPAADCSPVAWLDRHQVLGPATLCIHMVQAGPADLDLVAARGAAIAHCPRSNRRHGHGEAPLGAMLARRLRVGLGTDSVVSVAPLDLMAELAAARRLGGLAAERALRLATLDAAEALGLGAEVGSLRAGKWGDLAAFRLPGPVDSGRVADTLVSRTRADIVLTVLGGREVWRAGDGSAGSG